MIDSTVTQLVCGCDPEQGHLCDQAREIWKRIIDSSTAKYPHFDCEAYDQAQIDWREHFKRGVEHGS
jgi:hypothetical protein